MKIVGVYDKNRGTLKTCCYAEAARIVHVSIRTIHNWKNGERVKPYNQFTIFFDYEHIKARIKGQPGFPYL